MIRVGIIGPESTGKSTLCRQLSEQYGYLWIKEYAREYVEALGRPYTRADLDAIAGHLIEQVSYRMTTPGTAGECGLTFGQTRTMLQGLFIAPKTVNGAVKGAILCAKVFEKLGYEVCPGSSDKRSDIIQAVRLGTADKVTAFCKGVQEAAPIDANVTPVPIPTGGYEDPVIMAAGAFVQGSSIELSADAPMREPYNVYFQGGLTYEHSKFGVIKALDALGIV